MALLVTAAGKMVTALRSDDDFADRLNFRYTTAMMVVFSVLITSKQYVGQPIQCWAPEHFKKPHVQYAKDFCWIRNTYFLPFQSDIPREGQEEQLEERGGRMIAYYQWVPLILLIQAFLFYAPCGIWRRLGDNSGIDVGNLIESGQLIATVQMEDKIRKKIVHKMVTQVHRYLTSESALEDGSQGALRQCCTQWSLSLKHTLSRLLCPGFGRHRANYLVVLYLLVKLLYIGNVIGQLYALNFLLGASYHSYGIDVISSMLNGTDFTSSSMFPRVTMCDLRVRRLGAVHRYTIQCVLPINLFNEKIYLFLWFWMVFVAIVTCGSALSWFLRVVVPNERYKYVRRYVSLAYKLKSKDEEKVGTFIDKFLRHDGVFLLRLMTQASNALTTVDLTGALWKNYWKLHPPQSDVTLIQGTAPGDQSTLPVNGRRPGRDEIADKSLVKRKPTLDGDFDPLAGNG